MSGPPTHRWCCIGQHWHPKTSGPWYTHPTSREWICGEHLVTGMRQLSEAAMTPASSRDIDNHDRRMDARAEAIHLDEAYPPLPEDLAPVTSGSAWSTPQVPTRQPSPTLSSRAGLAEPKTSQPDGLHRPAA